jgi:hypothetical protein
MSFQGEDTSGRKEVNKEGKYGLCIFFLSRIWNIEFCRSYFKKGGRQTLKLVQERVRSTLELIGICKNFLNGTPAAQQLRDSIDKWDFIELKSFCSTKEIVPKLKRPQSGRKYLPATHQTKE